MQARVQARCGGDGSNIIPIGHAGTTSEYRPPMGTKARPRSIVAASAPLHELRNLVLVILRRLRRPQRRGSEIHAESFAPYGHRAVFRQVQVAAERVVLVADVALDDPKIDETSVLHGRYVLCIVRGDHVDVHIRTV